MEAHDKQTNITNVSPRLATADYFFPNFVMSNKYLLEFLQNPPVCSGPTGRCQEVSSSAPRGPQLKDWEQMIPSERLGFVFVCGKWLDWYQWRGEQQQQQQQGMIRNLLISCLWRNWKACLLHFFFWVSTKDMLVQTFCFGMSTPFPQTLRSEGEARSATRDVGWATTPNHAPNKDRSWVDPHILGAFQPLPGAILCPRTGSCFCGSGVDGDGGDPQRYPKSTSILMEMRHWHWQWNGNEYTTYILDILVLMADAILKGRQICVQLQSWQGLSKSYCLVLSQIIFERSRLLFYILVLSQMTIQIIILPNPFQSPKPALKTPNISTFPSLQDLTGQFAGKVLPLALITSEEAAMAVGHLENRQSKGTFWKALEGLEGRKWWKIMNL